MTFKQGININHSTSIGVPKRYSDLWEGGVSFAIVNRTLIAVKTNTKTSPYFNYNIFHAYTFSKDLHWQHDHNGNHSITTPVAFSREETKRKKPGECYCPHGLPFVAVYNGHFFRSRGCHSITGTLSSSRFTFVSIVVSTGSDVGSVQPMGVLVTTE